MLDDAPSRTALATAFIRAVHRLVDDPPPICDDPIAFELLPGYQRRYIQRLAALAKTWRSQFRQRRNLFTAMRAQVVVRCRYAEDALARARDAGADRYVVLAAGLDTFALRQADPAFAVLEIDHPATQHWKQTLLSQCGFDLPAGLTFLPIDFEKETLADAWIDNPGPDFISWMGATYYLTEDAVATSLATLAGKTRPGSELVLDYWREPPATDSSSWLLWGTRIAVAIQQEPMRSFFTPSAIEALAKKAGWRIKENCGPDEQDRRFLASRTDDLSVPSFAYLLHLQRQ